MPSLEQWLAYQTQVHPQAIDLGLDRLLLVLDRLGWRQPKVPVITIAGTNGKGSVSGYCAAILAAAGYRAGTFTSPHLRDYRERVRVHDRLVSAAELVSAFERIEASRGEVGLTFFEFNTLAALLVFEAARLDAWVLEIGMGGRLDAVNVVDPDAAVVVSIGFDHQEYLGATIEAIAREKAGIFRQGRPAVLGSRDMPGIVEDIARAIGAPLKRLGNEYSYLREGASWHFRGSRWNLPHLPAPALVGDMQYANAATAIAALEELDARLTIPAAAVAICATLRPMVGPWPYAGFWPTKTHPASWRNSAVASMPGGALPPREIEAAAVLRWPRWWRARSRRLSKQRTARLRDARQRWRLQRRRIGSSSSDPFTWQGLRWIGSRRAACCHRPRFPNILRRPEPTHVQG